MERVEVGVPRTAGDGPRRYRPFRMVFDTRANILATEVEPEWDDDVRAVWIDNKAKVREHLIHQYGAEDHERKIADFVELGAAPWSILDEHNVFLSQIRTAFTQGAYYPALVGACALGERILNELVLRLRDDFDSHPAAKKVAGVKAMTNWNLVIEVLVDWDVLDDPTATQFNELRKLRNKSVHYGAHLRGRDARDDSTTAVLLIQECVAALFTPLGGPPRFIAGTTGSSYIALAAEEEPLVRRFYLPNCVLVSPRHQVMPDPHHYGSFMVNDDEMYQEHFPVLSDEEFAEHLASPPTN